MKKGDMVKILQEFVTMPGEDESFDGKIGQVVEILRTDVKPENNLYKVDVEGKELELYEDELVEIQWAQSIYG